LKQISLYILLLGIAFPANAQELYTDLSHTDFRQYPDFNTKIELEQFKPELLNACVFFITNEIRAKKKLSILQHHQLLEAAATMHSNDMVDLDFFGHTNRKNKDRREPSDRAKQVGILNPFIAENIIEGFILEYKAGDEVIVISDGQFIDASSRDTLKARTYLELADSMMRIWMKSEGHRKNIVSKDALQLGCGCRLTYMKEFNNMPIVRATQCFQWFEVITE